MGTPPDKIPEIAVAELIDRYSVFLLDVYGVIMRGDAALPGAPGFIAELDRRGKRYYVVTNDASALPSTRAKWLQGLGLPVAPDRIITSGALLRGHFEANNLSGPRCVVLGPENSSRYVELAGGRVVPPTDDFDAIVIGDQSGFPFLETVNAVMSALFHKVDRHQKVHLILPNPDLIYPKGEQGYGVASGSVALVLESALQLRYPDRPDLRFARLGKPHRAIFAEALRAQRYHGHGNDGRPTRDRYPRSQRLRHRLGAGRHGRLEFGNACLRPIGAASDLPPALPGAGSGWRSTLTRPRHRNCDAGILAAG